MISWRSLATWAGDRSPGMIPGALRRDLPRASAPLRRCVGERAPRAARAALLAARRAAVLPREAARTVFRLSGIGWRQAWVDLTWSTFPLFACFVNRTRWRNATDSSKERAPRGPGEPRRTPSIR